MDDMENAIICINPKKLKYLKMVVSMYSLTELIPYGYIEDIEQLFSMTYYLFTA